MTNFVVKSGVTSGGVTLGGGDFLYVSSGGVADATTVNNGGTAEVLFGGMVSGTVVNSRGNLQVSSGGVASATMVNNKGNLVVSPGGVASGTAISGKGNALVSSGGEADFSVVSAGGTQTVASGGVASGTHVGAAGDEQISAGGLVSGATVNGGTEHVFGGTILDTTLIAGSEYVYTSGFASGTVVSPNGKLFVFAGSVASNTVLSGGYEYLFPGGVGRGTAVYSGGVVEVQSAGTVSGAVIHGGGQETVLTGGNASGTIVSGGFDGVFGQARDAVLVGGNQYVYSGGVASGTVARGEGIVDSLIEILAAGMSTDVIVSSGGQETVEAGGLANGTTVRSGGTLIIKPGGTASFAVISRGGSIDLPGLFYVPGGSAIVDLSGLLTVVEGLGIATLGLSGLYTGGVFLPGPESNGGTGTVITLSEQGNQNQAPPRTLLWTGAQNTGFANATNWNDLTNSLTAAVAPPNATDTVEFLTGGGAITDTGTAVALEFGGFASWQITSAASLSARTGVTVGQDGAGTLLINNGASVTGLGSFDEISGASGGVASVTVDGVGASWKSTGELIVGASGPGALTVSNAASLGAAATGVLPATALGANGGGNGALLVTGAGSTATLVGQLDVGEAGGGTLTVGNQGTLRTGNDAALDPSEGFDIAHLAGASGQATVTGAQSLLSNIGRFVVGDAGLGRLDITAGATVITVPGIGSNLRGAVIANAASARGSSVEVSGAGSNWRITGVLDVGVAGSGALLVSNGATVTADALDAGAIASAVGQIGLSGPGTRLIIANAATVADDGTGVLSVLNGATFSAASLTIGNTGNSSGAVIVSGAGSVINLTGALNVGTALGTGDITIGPGAAVHASVLSFQGQMVLEGGLADPTVQLIDQGQTAGGFGTIAAGFVVDEGVIQSKTAQRLLMLRGTVVGGGTLTINGTVQGSNPAGILQINAGGTMELTGAVLNAATTTFTDELTPAGTYTVNNSVVDVSFADAAGVLLLDDIAGFAGTITADQGGDRFVILGGVLSGLGVTNGHTLTFSDSGAGTGGTDRIIFSSAVTAAGFSIVNGNTVQVACFAEGTRIETETGCVAVEDLRVGQRVMTVRDRTAPDGHRYRSSFRRDPRAWPDRHHDKRPGTVDLFSVVILGLDPRISVSVHRAELPRIPDATDARVEPEHDVERAIPACCEGSPDAHDWERDAQEFEPIVWIGQRVVNCRAHPEPETVWAGARSGWCVWRERSGP